MVDPKENEFEKSRLNRFIDDEETAEEFSSIIPAEEVSLEDLKPGNLEQDE